MKSLGTAGRVGVAMLASALLGSCGLSYSVDRDILRELTIEQKLSLFDAENDVSIALDEREGLRGEIMQTRGDIAAAEEQIVEAQSDAARAADKGDAAALALGDEAAAVFDLKIAYLERQLDFLRERVEVQDAAIGVALARFELAKAKLVKRNNVRGASDIVIEDFEAQVSTMVERTKALQIDLAESAKEVEAERQVWLQARTALSQKSGGGIGSAWAESSAQWGAGDDWGGSEAADAMAPGAPPAEAAPPAPAPPEEAKP